MTQEEFYDLAQLIHCMAYRIMDSNPVDATGPAKAHPI